MTPAAELGGSAFRLTTLWSPGQTALAADEAVEARPRRRGGARRPADRARRLRRGGHRRRAAGRGRPRRLLRLRPHAARRAIRRSATSSIWNEPNKSLFWSPQVAADGSPIAAARYEALLARCYDVLHGAFPSVNVIGLALSSTGNDNAGSASPGAFIRGVGDAYRASGRTAPLLDTVGYHPYAARRGGAAVAQAHRLEDDRAGRLEQADVQPLPRLRRHGAGRFPARAPCGSGTRRSGFQTAVDAGKAGCYTGTENVATVPDYAGGEPDVAGARGDERRARPVDAGARRDPPGGVPAIRVRLLQLPARRRARLAGWQSGALWVDRTPKDSWPAFQQAIAEATGGTVDCGALKGGRPSADFMPPSAPTGLAGVAAAEPLRVDLSWSAAADDVGAVAYRVFRNGAHVGTTTATSWSNVSVAPETTYTYAVRAIDAAGNLGDASASVQVTTPGCAPPSAPGCRTGRRHARPGPIDLTGPPDNVGVALATSPAAADRRHAGGCDRDTYVQRRRGRNGVRGDGDDRAAAGLRLTGSEPRTSEAPGCSGHDDASPARSTSSRTACRRRSASGSRRPPGRSPSSVSTPVGQTCERPGRAGGDRAGRRHAARRSGGWHPRACLRGGAGV